MRDPPPAYGKQNSRSAAAEFGPQYATLGIIFSAKVMIQLCPENIGDQARQESGPATSRISLCVRHLLSQAERPHISPYFLNVAQTLLFQSTLAGIAPTECILFLGRPD